MSGQNLYDLFKTVDVMVVSPPCSESTANAIIRELRLADPQKDPMAFAARIFHEVLVIYPDARVMDLFAHGSDCPTFFKRSVLYALDKPGVEMLAELSDAEAMTAFNLARWLFGLGQKSFVAEPVRVPHQRSRPPAASQVMNLTRLNTSAVA